MLVETSQRFKNFFKDPSHGTYVKDVEELLLKVEGLETENTGLKKTVKKKEFYGRVLSALLVTNLVVTLFYRFS
jgi:hypothetical protein